MKVILQNISKMLSSVLMKGIRKENFLIGEGKPYLLLTLLFLIKFFHSSLFLKYVYNFLIYN